MATTYDVRVHKIHERYDNRESDEPTRYIVRWTVNRKRFDSPGFKRWAQADSFRSELVAAAKKGEAFDVEQGLPLSMLRTDKKPTPWLAFAASYCAARWDELSPGSRRNLVRDMCDITLALLAAERRRPETSLLAKALRCYFNPKTRHTEQPAEVVDAIAWINRHDREVGDLSNPDVFRRLISALDKKRDGTRAARDTIRLRRTTLGGAIEYASEQEPPLLDSNPLKRVKVRKNKTSLREVDTAAVVNPIQARTLLEAVRLSYPRLVAFFGLLYFAGLRPEEAVNIHKSHLSLPPAKWNDKVEQWQFSDGVDGWGEVRLERAVPEVSGEWTDSGERNEETPLKHREEDESRTVPCCPDLTILLLEHLRVIGTAPDGRLFWGARGGGRLSSSVYGRAWAKARRMVFVPEIWDSLLGKRPYDLRHACVSGWLAAGVEPPQVADWAGHSLAVLFKVYAKVIDRGKARALRRIAEWLGRDLHRS